MKRALEVLCRLGDEGSYHTQMLLLSVDVDFFVTPIAYHVPFGDDERLPSSEYKVERLQTVRQFLNDQLKLSPSKPVPGVFIRHHDQAFDVIAKLAESGPIDLVHVDAHADLGMGEPSWNYLFADWLPLAEPRPSPRDEVTPGNWLAFAAASGYLRSIRFMPQERKPVDLLRYYFRGDPLEANALEFVALTPAEDDAWMSRQDAVIRDAYASRGATVSVPWEIVLREEFELEQRPDFVLVCQSPQYTPRGADKIIRATNCLVRKTDIGLQLMSPIGMK